MLDFGLAKTAEAMSGTTPVTNSPTITSPTMMSAAGVILGTAGYMSPEQAKGLRVDKRSDVWAFGCVLYEMLTGTRAFAGDDVSDTLAAVLRSEPDWTALPKDVSTNTRLLLQCCLEKDRKKRIGDMSTARFLIAQPGIVDTAADVALRRPTPMWRRAVPFLVTAVVAAALVAGIAWTLRPSPTPATISRFTIPLPQGQVFTNDGRHVVAISPDGGQIVYVANGRLHLRSMARSRVRSHSGNREPARRVEPCLLAGRPIDRLLGGRRSHDQEDGHQRRRRGDRLHGRASYRDLVGRQRNPLRPRP